MIAQLQSSNLKFRYEVLFQSSHRSRMEDDGTPRSKVSCKIMKIAVKETLFAIVAPVFCNPSSETRVKRRILQHWTTCETVGWRRRHLNISIVASGDWKWGSKVSQSVIEAAPFSLLPQLLTAQKWDRNRRDERRRNKSGLWTRLQCFTEMNYSWGCFWC